MGFSVPAMRNYSEPVRKSSRVSSKLASYDDDIEILEVDDTPKRSKTSVSYTPAKEIDERKFGKLTLSAKRKIVEDYNNVQEENLENLKLTKAARNHLKIKCKQETVNNLKDSVVHIEVIEIDDEPKDKTVNVKNRTEKEDEELLLTEDEDHASINLDLKRKPINSFQTPIQKKLKTSKNEKSSDMIEVKSSSGKSMFVDKATLAKIMASKALKKVTPGTLDEKLLAEEGDQSMKTDFSFNSKRKTRSRGI